VKLSEMNQELIDKIRDKVLKPNPTPGSVRRGIIVPIRAIMLHACRRGWCERPFFEIPRQPGGRTHYLSPSEAKRLVAAAAPHLKPLLILMLCTGARVAEALELDWREVDLVGQRVTFWTKGNPRRRRVVPLEPRVRLALAALPHRVGPVFLWDRRRVKRPEPAALLEMVAASSRVAVVGRYGVSETAVRKWLKEAERELACGRRARSYADTGREYGGQIKGAWKGAIRRAGLDPKLSPHSLRHTWASWHYAIHRDPMLLKVDGQWSSVILVERYAHLMPAGHEEEILAFWGRSVLDRSRLAMDPKANVASLNDARSRLPR
jgi:integrase